MTSISLESLGISGEQLQNALVESLRDSILRAGDYETSDFFDKMQKVITKRLDERIEAITEEKVMPTLLEKVDSLVLTPTTRWGEKAGEPQSLVSYLVDHAEKHLTENVDSDGKTITGYGRDGKPSRIVHMLEKALQAQIQKAVSEALADFHKTMGTTLAEAVKAQVIKTVGALNVVLKA